MLSIDEQENSLYTEGTLSMWTKQIKADWHCISEWPTEIVS